MSVLTLTTDFGTGSPYVAAMKGVILSINPGVTLVDVTHDVRPQDARHAAIVLFDVSRRFPAEAIHVAVVDPGVGTDRAIVYARIGVHHYVAPDNGLLSRLAARTPPSRLLGVENPEYWLRPVSTTFHGRDVMAPVAAHLSLGLDPEKLGPPREKLLMLDWPEPVLLPGRIEGEILDIDSFGNLITNIEAEMLAAIPDKREASVELGRHKTKGICSTYAEQPPGALIALIGSTGRLELAVGGGNAARTLGARLGEPVTVRWQ